MDRRSFLAELTTIAAASGAALAARAGEPPAAPAPMPTIALGAHRVSRLIVGANPINGYSYLGGHTDQHMREYFTLDQSVEFLLACERAGITAHQFSTGSGKCEGIIRKARERGCKMSYLCLHGRREDLKQVVDDTRPIAVVHHGGATDRLFAEGKSQRVLDFVKATHDQGVMAGVSAHNPDCIRRVADEGWPVDLFMTCFYYVTRKSFPKPGEAPPPSETLDLVYPFHRNDPDVMTAVIRQVKQPCLGFKILAAGRMCADQNAVKGAFRYAFANVKPIDGVIVGMYPRFFDEISADAQYARECGQATVASRSVKGAS